MDWLQTTGASWLNVGAWLLRLGVLFGLLTWFMPCNRGMHWWQNLRTACTDLMYWLVAPLFIPLCQTFALITAVRLLFGDTPPGFAAIRESPLWLQCLGILVLQDIMLYWLHRCFHTRTAWRFHAVHHSPTTLDWTSAARFHPVNILLSFPLADIVVQLLGFTPAALYVLVPFNVYYSAMVHANLNWTFGPLKYVFASPVFHRWHHTLEVEGLNKNFASTFPILDWIFGTFYMPAGKVPQVFGNGEEAYPEDFLGQLIQPFHDGRASPQERESPQPLCESLTQ